MKKNIKNYVKIGLLLFGVSLFLNCEREENLIEKQEQTTINRISLTDFQNRISKKNYEEISNYFQGNTLSKTTSSDEFTILTESILISQNGNHTSFTFQVVKETAGDEFYNLILTIDENEEIINSKVYEYQPSVPYNSNTSSKFIGAVRTLPNHNLEINGLLTNRAEDMCVVDAVGFWECSFGNSHGPGECNGSWFIYDVRLVYGACSDFSTEPEFVDVNDGDSGTGEGNGPFDLPNGGGNNDNDDPNDDTIDTSPINEPLNYSEEIISCINSTSLLGGTNYYLSQSQEDWVNSAANRDLIPIYSFLQSNSCSLEAQEFALLALDLFLESTDPETSLDAIFRLFNGFTKPCHAELIFKALEVNSPFVNTFRTDLVNALDNNIAIQDLPASEIPAADVYSAVTFYELTNTLQYNDIVLIVFEEEYLNNASDLALVVTLYHEMLHATMVDLYHEGTLLNNYPNYTDLNTAFDNFFQNATTANRETLDKEMHDIYIDFIDPLAASIHKYAQDNNINSVTLDYAKKLVWGSLGAYDIFTENLTPAQQLEALNLLNNEQQNNNDAVSNKTCN